MIIEIYAQMRSLLMTIAAVYAFAFVAGALVLILVVVFTAEILKYRGPHIVMCPQTHGPALVRIDAMHAAFGRIIGERDLRMLTCSRWEAGQECAQECLKNWR